MFTFSIIQLATLWVLVVAIVQMELTRRGIRGEVFEKAKIKDLDFFIPSRNRYELEYYDQKERKSEENIGGEIEIPKDKEVEIFIRFVTEETQTVRSFEIHFPGNNLEDLPKITGSENGFIQKELEKRSVSEAIDWNNSYHLEYENGVKRPKGEPHLLSFTVEGQKPAEHTLRIWIYTDEAKEAYRKDLTVNVIGGNSFHLGKPNRFTDNIRFLPVACI